MMLESGVSMFAVLRIIWLCWIALALGGAASFVGGFMFVNGLMIATTSPALSDQLDSVPSAQLAIVLGAGPGSMTLENRLDASIALWKEGKVERILVTGGTDGFGYGETDFMYRYLRERDIPSNAILVDEFGLRTLDSVQRAKTVFGAERVIVVTQQYHAYRGVFLARAQGMRAFGFIAENGDLHYFGSTRLREFFARGNAFLDVLMGRQATHGDEWTNHTRRVEWWHLHEN